jgi:chorismate mutase
LICDKISFSPDEYPFSKDLPEPVLPPLHFPAILYPNKINTNPSILSFYTCAIVPRITRRATLALAAKKRANGITGSDEFEDDGNYGSAATLDVEVLQSISKRVHYGRSHFTTECGVNKLLTLPTGKFVSESKFMENPAAFIPHILNPNRAALEELVTKPEVERKLLVRLQKKASTYAQDIVADEPLSNGVGINGVNGKVNGKSTKIDVDGVVDLYESYIIPLTKEVEVSPQKLESLSLEADIFV